MLNFDDIFNHHQSLFLYGKTNSGKTSSILNYLKNNNKTYHYLSIQEIKNENQFTTLLNSQNVYNMFYNKKITNKYIIIDNLDYIQNNDKKILNYFIKFFKQKKEKLYKNIFFIFIGTNNYDNKIKELMNYLSFVYEYKSQEIVDYDKIVKDIVCCYLNFEELNVCEINEKNIISLCYHENITKIIDNNLHYYEIFLKNFCGGDYYDRISFKKQLWQLNEMTFYIKVVYNCQLLKDKINKTNNINNIIFTKILTKFSNEYSNQNFIINICNKLKCQKEELYNFIINNNINKLNILLPAEYKRICKLLTQEHL